MKTLIYALLGLFLTLTPVLGEEELPGNVNFSAPRAVKKAARSVIQLVKIVPVNVTLEGEEKEVPLLHSAGSAVIVGVDYKSCTVELITAKHVVGNVPERQLFFANGGGYIPETLVRHPNKDIAYLQVIMYPCDNLRPLKLGKAPKQDADLGEYLYFIGYPADAPSGVIRTGDHQSVMSNQYTLIPDWVGSLIVFYTRVTAGMSGGAVVDPKGRLVGITVGTAMMPILREWVAIYMPVGQLELELLRCGEACSP